MIKLKSIWPISLLYKERPKNWPHQIIDFLYSHYAESFTELNRYLYVEFNFEKENTTHKDNIKVLLQDLQSEEYVKWKVIKVEWDDYDKWVKDNFQEEFQTLPGLVLRDNRVEARLTIKGLNHAIELRRERQRHKYFLIVTPISLVISILAACLSIWTAFIKPKDEPATHKIELLQSDTIPIQIIQKLPQNVRMLQPHPATSLKDSLK